MIVMPDADKALMDSLEEQGVSREYSRRAIYHLRAAGVEPDTVDIGAEYDSSIGIGENVSNFKKRYPGESVEHMARKYSRDHETYISDAQDVELLEQRRRGGYAPKHGRLPAQGQVGGGPWKKQPPQKSEFDKDVEATQAHAAREPDILTRTRTWVDSLKRGHEQRVLAGQKERAYKAAQRITAESKGLAVARAEAQARRMALERQHLERAGREAALQNIPVIGGLMGGGRSRYDSGGIMGRALLGTGRSRGNSMGQGIWRATWGDVRSPVMASMLGQPAEPRRKPRYITVVQRGRVVRVDVNNLPSPGQAQPEARSPLQSAMFGNEGSGTGLRQALFGGQNKSRSALASAMFGQRRGRSPLGRMFGR